MATLDQIVPVENEKWFVPMEDEYPEFEILLRHVDSKTLDVITVKSQKEIRKQGSRGRIEVKEVFSNERAARVYAEEVFLNFRGLEDGKGKPLKNTLETRINMLQNSNTLLTYIINVTSDDARFTEEAKSEADDDFLEDSGSLSSTTETRSERISEK